VPDLTSAQWALAILAGLLVGISKTGVAGLGIISILVMAEVFPARESTGIVLVMLIVGDVMAVAYYRRHANWRLLVGLLPWVLPGILLGNVALAYLNDAQMRPVLGGLVLALLVLQAARTRMGDWMENKLPHTWWFAAGIGILAGAATMLANAAGPITIMYFLAKGLPKKEFMGTGAWFYFIVNLIKVPFSAGQGLITFDHLAFNAYLVPVILAGAIAGAALLPRVPQKIFNNVVFVLAVAASLKLIFL
jgi:hypothetical protein